MRDELCFVRGMTMKCDIFVLLAFGFFMGYSKLRSKHREV